MTDFPRRDEHGRIERVVDLLGFVLAGIVFGVVVLLVVDGAVALLGRGTFGGASGWLAAVLPGWLFVEEFRAWRGTRWRFAVALACAAVGLALGLAVAGAVNALPPLASGAIGATVATLAYASLWFYGVRKGGVG
jgi:hypothetical protein